MYRFFEPNPARTGAGDCAVRAIAKALNISWEEAYKMLVTNGYQMGDIPSADYVWGSVLRQHGFKRYIVPGYCPDCFTVADLCEEYPYGVFVVKSQDHVATVVDGTLYDSWPSQDKTVLYFWTREDV